MEKKLIKFSQSYLRYNPGDVAAFEREDEIKTITKSIKGREPIGVIVSKEDIENSRELPGYDIEPLVLVEMLMSYRIYNPGDVAGFSREKADFLTMVNPDTGKQIAKMVPDEDIPRVDVFMLSDWRRHKKGVVVSFKEQIAAELIKRGMAILATEETNGEREKEVEKEVEKEEKPAAKEAPKKKIAKKSTKKK